MIDLILGVVSLVEMLEAVTLYSVAQLTNKD